MKLTRRQEAFIYNLLDLYRELEGPIHYSALAKRVGVSPFTAYDMLRLLEEKGLAASEYRVDSDKPFPGRSEVFFWPTEQAHNLWKKLAGATDTGDWEMVKNRVLNRIRDGGLQDRELAEQMLARVPPERSPILRYCVEIITILALRLKRGAGRQLLAEYLQKILTEQDGASRVNLSLLSGFALGVFANENEDSASCSSQMLDHVQRYQSLIMEMDTRLMKRLIKNLAEVFSPLAQTE
jgi:DNA-binding MarR family transcriptional regulator